MDDQILDTNQLPDEIMHPEPPNPWYKNWKITLPLAVVVIAVLGLLAYVFFGRNGNPTPVSNQVGLTITGPDKVDSGSEAQFHIQFHNGEDGDLTNVHVDLIYPGNFQFKSSTPSAKTASGQSFDLPIVKKGQNGDLVVRGILKGATGEDKQIVAKLYYRLSTFNSTFQVEQTFHTMIQPPKLTFEITGPAEVPIGQDTSLTLNYSNVSGHDYENLAITLIYPDEFKFTASSVPPAKSNNYWNIGHLETGSSGHIDVSGSFIGENLDEQLLTGMLGQVISGNFAAQIVSTATFRLKSAPLGVFQEADPSDHVGLGNSIEYTINYSNESAIGLTNLVITDTFDTNLVDTSRLAVSDAVITGSTITWKAATNRSLALLSPSQKGEVHFSLPLKSSLPATVKNQIIKNSVTISSAEITTPIRAQDTEVKLSGNLKFDIVGDFVSGAQPMQVGKKSVYAITFLLSSTSNDMESAEVVAGLPLPPSAWNDVVIPDSEKSRLHYDASSGIIRWDVGDLPAFTGKLTPAAKVTFQLEVTPNVSDQGQAIKLLSDIKASARDSFTNENLSSSEMSQYSTTDIDDQFQSLSGTVQ